MCIVTHWRYDKDVVISVHERSSGTEPILSALAATRDNTSAQDSGALVSV